jgi:hypothetical protein
MKNSLKIIVGLLMITALVACGGSGGGSNPSPAAGPAAYNATAGSVGQGTWNGVLQGNGSQQYMTMMGQLGGYSPNMDLQITTYNGGQLPGQVGVTIGYSTQFYAQAFVSGNAFSATYTPGMGGGYGGGGYPYGQQCAPGVPCAQPCAPGVPCAQQPGLAAGQALIQINTQFVDPCTEQIMNVQVIYQGVQVASGQLTSNQPIQTYVYNPSCPNQMINPYGYQQQNYNNQGYYNQYYYQQYYYPGYSYRQVR